MDVSQSLPVSHAAEDWTGSLSTRACDLFLDQQPPPTQTDIVNMADLSSLLTSSRQLTAHIPRPDLPTINLGLDQIEQQSRRLVAGQPTAPDQSKAFVFCSQTATREAELLTLINY